MPDEQPRDLHKLSGAPTEVDAYLNALDEPKRSTLQTLRSTILEIAPRGGGSDLVSRSGVRLRGKIVAGFAAFNDQLSYLPFSGSVLGELRGELEGYTITKSALHFPVDRPLPKALVKKLIEVRLGDAARR
jgi:uncharacterized protein YdhG (YjbR/CyaY superfamily)